MLSNLNLFRFKILNRMQRFGLDCISSFDLSERAILVIRDAHDLFVWFRFSFLFVRKVTTYIFCNSRMRHTQCAIHTEHTEFIVSAALCPFP